MVHQILGGSAHLNTWIGSHMSNWSLHLNSIYMTYKVVSGFKQVPPQQSSPHYKNHVVTSLAFDHFRR